MKLHRPSDALKSSTTRPSDASSVLSSYNRDNNNNHNLLFADDLGVPSNHVRGSGGGVPGGLTSSLTAGGYCDAEGVCSEYDEFGASTNEFTDAFSSTATIDDYREVDAEGYSKKRDNVSSFLNKRVSTFTKNMTTLSRMASDAFIAQDNSYEEAEKRRSLQVTSAAKPSASLAKPSMMRGRTIG